ncbi:hypothetical protein DFH08DRAFT_833902 [Mycena albidolilacea]|uniref:Uncharacterized protein n=1 Tax=Mycena albidolilacea TaxID=1033008 RepID=A0AAD7AQZ9_9AGAR|nr:hypothetical protein DFH08DRAFT_833902 [Mycena albidolilacea]
MGSRTVLQQLSDTQWLLQSCLKLQWAWMILIVSQETIIEATLCICVFAMYSLNKLVLTCLMGVTCIVAGLGLWAIVGYGKRSELLVVSGLSGCHATLVCDILVFALTSCILVLYAGLLLHADPQVMCFGIIVLATPANILTFYVSLLFYLLPCYRSDLITSLSVTLFCQLMLNLYQAGGLRMDTAELNIIDLESIQFVVLTTVMTVDERL